MSENRRGGIFFDSHCRQSTGNGSEIHCLTWGYFNFPLIYEKKLAANLYTGKL